LRRCNLFLGSSPAFLDCYGFFDNGLRLRLRLRRRLGLATAFPGLRRVFNNGLFGFRFSRTSALLGWLNGGLDGVGFGRATSL
jgi:hypothetical protein